ncbi:hypothetical protein RRG08_045500 [Elysia crispata]|uniref:Uncharacterized protein n=1 Tax=Elysia crispata TaxID=231223 RepID=A0AAE1AE12_9GAST|nr:hypothetical protein RRG08_045500 [Elysia crispata]
MRLKLETLRPRCVVAVGGSFSDPWLALSPAHAFIGGRDTASYSVGAGAGDADDGGYDDDDDDDDDNDSIDRKENGRRSREDTINRGRPALRETKQVARTRSQ